MKNISILVGWLVIVSISNTVFAADTTHAKGAKKGANLDLFATKKADATKATSPEKPKLLEPAFKALVTGEMTTLKWEASKEATGYHLQVATDPNFKWLLIDNWNLKATSFEVKGLVKGNNYFWRVAGVKDDNHPGTRKGFFSTNTFNVR